MDLSIFNTASLFDAATDLFNQLNIQLNSNTSESLPARDVLKDFYREVGIFQEIQNTYFIGIINESIFGEVGLFDERYSYKQALEQSERNYDGLMFFALELSKHPTRTEISDLTRAFNRISQKMPVGLLLKYDNSGEAVISITISERFKYKQNWRQGEKAGKVIILRDIHTINTHAGHIRILKDLVKPVAVTSYSQLHEHWLQVLDVNILNKRFFQELANWYFWALDIVEFPDDVEKDKEVRNATNLIRLITRIIFIWFIKEKRLVPNNLFRKDYLEEVVVDFMKNNKSENFYNAILQNLFFGTLNQIIEDREFVKEGSFLDNREEYGVTNRFRYSDKFLISKNDVKALFKDIPFLNGGLFDCLDKPDDDGKIIYVDGFSRNPKKQSHIPDNVFFSDEIEIDLNEIYGTRSKRYKVQGLINLLDSYKFTVAENTPVEEEIALDPELLGKVFENLLASYNPETKSTARKQTGSFYTPREIVNYMVDESLIEFLKYNCNSDTQGFEENLRNLFSYSEDVNPFEEEESKSIIKALNKCKILDPACGSGAFPMGILHKMVHILNKLDPENLYWKQLQKERAIEETNIAYDIEDHEERKRRLDEIEDVFENNISDYGRKLYLIENCIYGIDIQPIAVQIAKLRFFISLIINQNKFEDRENYGIRSLPNLETKFVAANTLISLEKPQLMTGDIFLNDTYQEINKLSSQLKEIRHKYFNAKIREEKLKFQKEDKKLRKEISTLLVKVGHTTINAHKIAAFDPYDQNHFANWFEPEWMFGKDVGNGFSIIIGNPPYINVENLNSEIKKYLFEHYQTCKGRTDIYIAFIELSMKILSVDGILSYIIPYAYTNQNYGSLSRKMLIDRYYIREILDTSEYYVFENAIVKNTIISIVNSSNKGFTNIKIAKSESDFKNNTFTTNHINQREFKDLKDFRFETKDISSALKIKSKIWSKSVRLDEICLIAYGARLNHKSENCGKDIYIFDNYKKGFKPFLEGKNIDRFLYTQHGWLNYCPDEHYNAMFPELFETPKIIFINVVKDKLRFAYDTEKFYNSHTVINCVKWDLIRYAGHVTVRRNISAEKIRKASDYSYLFLLGLLNSKTINWYFNKFLSESLHFYPDDAKELPIPKIEMEKQKEINQIVEKVLSLKKENIDNDTSFFERQIDEFIYNIYDFSTEEKRIIEEQ